MHRYALGSSDANRRDAAASVLAFLRTTAAIWDPCTNWQWGGGEGAVSQITASLLLFQPSWSQSPLHGKRLHGWCWVHDDLSSSFTCLVLGQCVPTASPTADPPLPCDFSLGDSCPLISISLFVCTVLIHWRRWKKHPLFHSMVILVLSQTTSLSSLSRRRQARLEGREVLGESSSNQGICGETKQLRQCPPASGLFHQPQISSRQVISSTWRHGLMCLGGCAAGGEKFEITYLSDCFCDNVLQNQGDGWLKNMVIREICWTSAKIHVVICVWRGAANFTRRASN